MEKGSKEWFARLEENYDFPAHIAFYYATDRRIYSSTIDTKANDINEIRYRKVRPFPLDGAKIALLGVNHVRDGQHYYDISEKYAKHWIKESRY